MKRAALLIILIVLLLLSFTLNVVAELGTNWTGEFFDDANFSAAVRTITGINGISFNWPGQPNVNGLIVSEVEADNFSVRFTSSQNFVADNYRFDVSVDDNVRIYIDGQQVFEDFTGGPVKNLSFTRTMTAGTHTLRVDFVEIAEAAVIQFQWTQGGVASTPGTVAPTLTPIPPLTASVSTSVRGLALRSGPYLGASLVTVAFPGESYPVFASNASEEGVTWYQITVGGHTGWSSGRYLDFNVENPTGIPGAGSVFDTLDNPPDTGVYAAPRAVMNLRTKPSTRTPIIGSIAWGEEVPLLNRTVQGGKNFWFQVRHNGVVGWIYAPFVSVRGDINAVPVR